MEIFKSSYQISQERLELGTVRLRAMIPSLVMISSATSNSGWTVSSAAWTTQFCQQRVNTEFLCAAEVITEVVAPLHHPESRELFLAFHFEERVECLSSVRGRAKSVTRFSATEQDTENSNGSTSVVLLSTFYNSVRARLEPCSTARLLDCPDFNS
jgi:hypothetical protein